MNIQAQRRLLVLTHVLAGELDGQAAAEILGLSGRHVDRLLARYRADGAAAFVHGNRGRTPVIARLVEPALSTWRGRPR